MRTKDNLLKRPGLYYVSYPKEGSEHWEDTWLSYSWILILFRKGNGSTLHANVLGQRFKGKTHKEINDYLEKYVAGIKALTLPSEFKLSHIQINIFTF